eukprot:scaffold14246_cov105-Isochrysis_galbana.AAC.7
MRLGARLLRTLRRCVSSLGRLCAASAACECGVWRGHDARQPRRVASLRGCLACGHRPRQQKLRPFHTATTPRGSCARGHRRRLHGQLALPRRQSHAPRAWDRRQRLFAPPQAGWQWMLPDQLGCTRPTNGGVADRLARPGRDEEGGVCQGELRRLLRRWRARIVDRSTRGASEEVGRPPLVSIRPGQTRREYRGGARERLRSHGICAAERHGRDGRTGADGSRPAREGGAGQRHALGGARQSHDRHPFPGGSGRPARLSPRVQDGSADERRRVPYRKHLVHQMGFVKLEPDLDNFAEARQAGGEVHQQPDVLLSGVLFSVEASAGLAGVSGCVCVW